MTTKAEINYLLEGASEENLEKILDFVKNLVTPHKKTEAERKAEIFARLDELFAKEKPLTEEQKKRGRERAEQFSAACKKIRDDIGDDIPWASEEEMIEELANDRRERMKNANYA